MKTAALAMALILLLVQEPQQDVTTLSVDVRMVEVYASVFDQKGQRVENLQKENFEILEDGAKQDVQVFEPQVSGSSVALLIDTTASMMRQLPQIKNELADLLSKLDPDDEIGLFSFSTSLKRLSPFTKNRGNILSALSATQAAGATALYDALSQLSRDLSKTGGKKVIVLFTDGLDNRSLLRLDSAASNARRIGVPVYTIAQGELLQDSAGLKRLKDIASQTNGIAFEAHNAADMRSVFTRVEEDLQHLYLLGYYSTNADSRTEWRRLTVRLPQHPEYKLRAREGYYR